MLSSDFLVMTQAAAYIRTDPNGELPSREEQLSVLESFAKENGYELLRAYEDLDASGTLLYHKPSLKNAINNIKEEEEWEVLIAAHPRCISDDETALHELVHKFSLYGNRLECPGHSWEELLAAMKTYRREMSRR